MITLENLTILEGKDLKVIPKGYVKVEGGRIVELGSGRAEGELGRRIDGRGHIAVPGLINAHTHIGDGVAKERGLGRELRELVEPPWGLKHKILNETPEPLLAKAMRGAAEEMLQGGVTVFADFREGGLRGLTLELEALSGLPIRFLPLGRPSFNFRFETLEKNEAALPESALAEVGQILGRGAGLGLSSPNQYTDKALRQMAEASEGRGLRAVHVGEDHEGEKLSKARTGRGEVERALDMFKADLLIHLTHATPAHLEMVAERGVGVVCCPRSNAVLGLGFPPIRGLVEEGVRVALGTDNVMLNSPDLFREMEFTSKALRAHGRDPAFPTPIEVLKMATVNGAAVLGLGEETGVLAPGKRADIVLIGLEQPNMRWVEDPVAAIVHRAGVNNVGLVMVGGEVAYTTIEG